MKVEMRLLNSITLYEGNPRVNDTAVAAVAGSIQEFGFRQPIVVDAKGVIVCGSTRYKAAKKLGLIGVPVHEVTDLSDAEIKAYRIADNKTAELADWNDDLLAIEIGQLDALDFDLPLLGFDDQELDAILGREVKEGLTDPDAVPEPPDDPITKPGDLWLLGEHRLLCGDATKWVDVARVMGDEVATMCLTDPPYGVDYGGHGNPRWSHKHTPIQNDALDGNDLEAFWVAAFQLASTEVSGDVYVAAPAGPLNQRLAAALAQTRFEHHQWLIWVKDRLVLGRSNYHYRHEHLWYGWLRGSKSSYVGGRDQDSVWQVPRPSRSDNHPTMKPVELMGRAIRNSSCPGHIVLDMFLGSGTTMIAAEQLGRRCYGMEIEPKYVDVAVRRWEQFTGRKAEHVPMEAVA